MELEIEELKEEISLLTEKVEILERKERQRKSMFYVKLLIKFVLLASAVYGAFKLYDYVVREVPNIMENKIKELNPLNKYM